MIAVPFLDDLRSAMRILIRSPAYALTSIAVLALGIGANVAIFSVVYSVVLSPLPYPDPSRLVFVWQRLRVLSDPVLSRSTVYHKNYLEMRRQNTVFDAMAAYSSQRTTMRTTIASPSFPMHSSPAGFTVTPARSVKH